ncbi:MAG: hypothetical protein AAF570_03810, partial [Bacteroidota bacterium]
MKYFLILCMIFPTLNVFGQSNTVIPARYAEFGTLSTVVGCGKIREKGENGWEAKFEGGVATAAELSR